MQSPCPMLSYSLLSEVLVVASCFCILLTACLPCIANPCSSMSTYSMGFLFFAAVVSFSSATASWLPGRWCHSQPDNCINHSWSPFLSKHLPQSHIHALSSAGITQTRVSYTLQLVSTCCFHPSPGLMSFSDHRMVGVGRDTWRSSSQTHPLKQVHIMPRFIQWMSATESFIYAYKLCEHRREKDPPPLSAMNFLAFFPLEKKRSSTGIIHYSLLYLCYS